ncbi:MAG: murein biosynthesis integral membrane protein MurJ, partial [Candidatus Cloacimonetes bacterium HGW-Cloacimonetes-1]
VFLSRIFGLLRDQVMAFFFGAGFLNDAFNVAYTIPNLLRRLFGEGALSTAFVPIYNEIGSEGDRNKQFDFALNVLSILTLFLAVLTILGIIFAKPLVALLYPGLAPETALWAIKLTRIIFPYLFFIGLSSTMIAVLNSHDYFFMTGLSSALLNIGMILTVVVPHWILGIEGESLIVWAGWGVFLGGLLQTLVNFPYLKRIGYRIKLIIKFTGTAIAMMWKRLIPSMVGIGIREINLIADSIMASFLPIGSITALGFGNRLMQLPLGIFAISTGTAVLPLYSRCVSQAKYEELSESVRFSTVSLAYMILPVTTMIMALGGDFVEILFRQGQFDSRASLMTTQALLFYSIGLIFYSLNQTITPLFYANKDTKTPMYIAAVIVGLNITLNFILMQFIQHRGLALSTSITAMINYFLLLYLIRKKMPRVSFHKLFPNIAKALVICIVIYIPMYFVNTHIMGTGRVFLIIKDAIFSIVVFTVFFILASLLKIEYINQVRDQLWSKLLRK